MNLPDGFITSPGPNRGGEEFKVNTEDIESLRLVMESLRSTYNDNWFHHVGIGDGTWSKLKIKNVKKN